MIPSAPIKPFPDYKWRWASFTPGEGLLRADVYLGVLRAFAANEGKRNGEGDVLDALKVVQEQTGTDVNLSRSGERNLIRNSGQYWKGPGLIESTTGKIELTDFGKQVAEGRVTDTEFALAVVKTLTLPNLRIDSVQTLVRWKAVGLQIKPLELLLSIMGQMEQIADGSQGYITANEAIRVVIPLAGVKTSIQDHADALIAYRKGVLNVSGWPDCAPKANDRRMAREFLLFLWHHGLCRCEEDPDVSRYDRKFSLASLAASDVTQLEQLATPGSDILTTLKDVRLSQLPAIVEEGRRVLTSVLSRPQQADFRRAVLKAYGSTCLVTGEKMPEVLEAAHIVPKRNKGADTSNNGVCLRADVHKLFDAGHIRIEPGGKLHYSDAMLSSVSYTQLPASIGVPKFVTPDAIEWRWRYQ